MLLQKLIEIQRTFNYIPYKARAELAESLNISRAEIDSVISFYTFLEDEYRGDYIFRFSDNIVDQMQEGREIAALITPGEQVSVGFTSCTGMGDQGPAALINDRPLTGLNPERITDISKLIAAKKPLIRWPAEYFAVKPNIKLKNIMLAGNYEQGYAIKAALADRAGLLSTLEQAGLRGRGGAGFPTALKWKLTAEACAKDKVVVCNADEGEPGSFKDRALLQAYADRVFEGMTACAAAIGADRGYLYLRWEYAFLQEKLTAILTARRKAGLLGRNILASGGFDFDISIHLGAGAYICGEETALINSLEGRRGYPRMKPPFPVNEGFCGLPTVINNVETFAAAVDIIQNGVKRYRAVGTKESPGSKILSISGDCAKPGVYEVPFGTTVTETLNLCEAEDTQAVQISGPAGELIPRREFNRRLGYDELATNGSFMVFNNDRDIWQAVENFIHFFRHESCGFCTPCRVGASLLARLGEKRKDKKFNRDDAAMVREIAGLMNDTSFCGLGKTAAGPFVQYLDKFSAEFGA